MQLHFEILDQPRKKYFAKLSVFKKVGYLAGGTALALQVGHRVSYDFDVFCFEEIGNAIILKAKENFTIKEVLINSADEFSFLTPEDVKVSFIFYPFELKKFLMQSDALPLPILSSLGIAATKAYALNRRASWRDYLDLFAVINDMKISFSEILLISEKIYGTLFNKKLFFAQLLYTEDISPEEIRNTKLLTGEITLPQIKAFFGKEIEKQMH